MTTHLLQADTVVQPHHVAAGALVEITGNKIHRVGHFDTGDAHVHRVVGTLMPGFVDLQVNGAGGHSVDDTRPEALDAIAAAVRKGGATAFLPTLISAPLPVLEERLQALAQWIEGYAGPGAQPLGVHMEGPFLQDPGAHDPESLAPPTPANVQRLLDAANGRLRLLTLAPGVEGAAAAVRQLREAGVMVALGHGSGAAGVADCVAAGATLATHLFNAMGGSHHREPGMVGALLDEPGVRCGMIADGVHVDEIYLRWSWSRLGPDRLILVTDGTAASGMPDGDYQLAGMKITRQDGTVVNAQGDLAGSCLTMAEAGHNFLRMVPDAGAWTLSRVAAQNPAAAIGVFDRGAIRAGNPAEFCVLAEDGQVTAPTLQELLETKN